MMFLPVVVTLLGLWSVRGQASDFTINSIELIALPGTGLKNGDNLELQCVVKFAKTEDLELNSTFSFYMDDTKVYINSSTGNQVSYIIPNVRVSNNANYRCDVNVEGRIQNSKEVEIKVTGLSRPLINVSKNEINEGEDVTVRCEAPEEWSFMKFTFYKIYQNVIEKKFKHSYKNYEDIKFQVKEGEEFLQFNCDVEFIKTQETSLPSEMITVTVVAPFSKPRMVVSPSLNFTEGINMSVTCSVQKAPKRSEDMKLTLQRNGHIIESSTNSTLSYSKVATVEDMGNYTCKVESRRTSKSSSAEIVIIELFPRPRLTLLRNNKAQYIQHGESITLKCSVDGLEPQTANRLTYRFLRGTRRFTIRGGKLELFAEDIHSGSYVCQVTIANITKQSQALDVQIYAPVKNPVLTHIMRSNKTVVLGDTLELTCKIQSGTPPITYSLLRGNDLLVQQTIYGDTEARFLVNSSKSPDLGQYKCQATNRNVQSASKYSNLVSVTVIIPISGVHLTIVPEDGNVEEGAELSLICQVKDGTLPITFLFYRKKGNEVLLKNVTEKKEQNAACQVFRFSKQEDGVYFCTASNGAQKEVRSNPMEARAVLATWKKWVIGLFVLLVILAAIGICAYLHKDKKKKGKDISTKKNRSSNPITTNNEKSGEEMKSGEVYYGNIKNEDELHILKSSEESPGKKQQNHEEEQTEGDGARPDAPQEAVENNVNRTEDAPEANNHP